MASARIFEAPAGAPARYGLELHGRIRAYRSSATELAELARCLGTVELRSGLLASSGASSRASSAHASAPYKVSRLVASRDWRC
jgi:hypothetical protein